MKIAGDNVWVSGHLFNTPLDVLNFFSMYRGWLERESRYGLQPGHNWFIISMQWWQQWKDYVKYVSMIPAYLHFSWDFQFHQTLRDYWLIIKCSNLEKDSKGKAMNKIVAYSSTKISSMQQLREEGVLIGRGRCLYMHLVHHI